MTPAERQQRRRQAPSHIVTKDGGVWRLSSARYTKLLDAVRSGHDYDLNDLGTFLGVISDPEFDAVSVETSPRS